VAPPSAHELAARLRPILANSSDVTAAWLFGSAARGELRADSDVDVGLLLTNPKWTAVDRYALLGELAARMEGIVSPRQVDLVLLEHQGPVFAHEALIDGVLIFDRDRERRLAFEADTVLRSIDFRPTLELARAEQRLGMREWLRAQR
jgi:predicted nucleotidyltransferase